jgi:hypothetical protein
MEKNTSFVIQCPNAKCGNSDLDDISWFEMVPNYANLQLEEDGTLTVRSGDSELYYEGAGVGKLTCDCCGHEWAMPSNAKVNWE